MHAEAAFNEPGPSIDLFLKMSSAFNNNQFREVQAVTEVALHRAAEEDTDEAIYVDFGRMRIIWVVCETVCQTYMRN